MHMLQWGRAREGRGRGRGADGDRPPRQASMGPRPRGARKRRPPARLPGRVRTSMGPRRGRGRHGDRRNHDQNHNASMGPRPRGARKDRNRRNHDKNDDASMGPRRGRGRPRGTQQGRARVHTSMGPRRGRGKPAPPPGSAQIDKPLQWGRACRPGRARHVLRHRHGDHASMGPRRGRGRPVAWQAPSAAVYIRCGSCRPHCRTAASLEDGRRPARRRPPCSRRTCQEELGPFLLDMCPRANPTRSGRRASVPKNIYSHVPRQLAPPRYISAGTRVNAFPCCRNM